MSTSLRIIHPGLDLSVNLGAASRAIVQKPNLTMNGASDPPAWMLIRILDYILVFGDHFNSSRANEGSHMNNYSARYIGDRSLNRIVHCISRLDAEIIPTELPQNCCGNSSLYHCFQIGANAVDSRKTVGPQALLSVLGVSRRWHFFGCIAFYSRNTFAFSSLGE